MKNMQELEQCFENAIEQGHGLVAVKIEMQGFARPEVIINQNKNFETKLAYYKKAYNDDLTLKTFNGIKIIDFTSGNNFETLQKNFLW